MAGKAGGKLLHGGRRVGWSLLVPVSSVESVCGVNVKTCPQRLFPPVFPS